MGLQSLKLISPNREIDLYAGPYVMDGDHDLGEVPTDGSPRPITLKLGFWDPNNTQTLEELEASIRAVNLLLDEARDLAADGIRAVRLEALPDGLSVPTIWDLLGGKLQTLPPWGFDYLANHEAELKLQLLVEPTARSDEADVVISATLSPLPGITHRFVNHTGGTVFGANTAPLPEGSLWQSDIFTLSPTPRTPQVGDELYFGNTDGPFTELILRLRQAGSGITYSPYEVYNGTTWVTLVPSRDDFKTAQPFDTVAPLGKIAWSLPGAWSPVAVNSITASWIRLRVTAVASPVAPLFADGPISSLRGRAEIPAGSVRGSTPARAKATLTLSTSTPLGGLVLGARAGRLADVPPPHVAGWAGTDLDISSSSITCTVSADADALFGTSVLIQTGTALPDRAQRFSGGAYLTSEPAGGGTGITAGDKIDALGQTSFFFEIPVYFNSLGQEPVMLQSRWDTVDANNVFWFGVERGVMRAIVYNIAGSRKSIQGATQLQTGQWYILTYEFRSDKSELRVYVNTGLDGRGSAGKSQLRSGLTTALRGLHSVGFDTDDSAAGQAELTTPDVTIAWIWSEARSLDSVFGSGRYPFPDDKRTTEGYAGGASTKWFLELEDNVAAGLSNQFTLVDSSAAPKNARRSTGATSATSVAGYLQPGGGALAVKALSMRLAQSYGREHGGRYRVFLRARPVSTLLSIDDVTFSLQFGPGDPSLPMQVSGLRFPDTASPSGAYYWLDCGPVTLPQAALGSYRDTEAARSWLRADLFLTYNQSAIPSVRADALLLVPTDAWYADYATFDTAYAAAQAVAQGEAFLLDSTGPEPLAYQTDTALVPKSNAYAIAPPTLPRLRPDLPHWIVAIPLRGSAAGTDHLESAATDRLVATVTVQPHHVGMAS